MKNKIGKIIEIRPLLDKHSNEISCATQGKICEYLNMSLGEVYVVFNDKDNIHFGELCKIKEDVCAGFSLAAFTSLDDTSLNIPPDSGNVKYWKNKGHNGNAIVYLNHWKYFMRLG